MDQVLFEAVKRSECLVKIRLFGGVANISEESAIILGGCIRAVVFQGKSRVIIMLVS